MVDSRGGVTRPALLMVVCAASTQFEVLWFGANVLGPWGPGWIGWIAPPVGALAAVGVCWSAAAVPGVPRAAARFWRQFGFALVFIAAATLSNAVDASTGPVALSQELRGHTMALYIATVLTVLWALLRVPAGIIMNRAVAVRFALDAGVVVITAGVFAWFVSYRQFDTWVTASGSIVPVLAVVMMGFTTVLAFAKLAITGAGVVDRAALRLLAAAAAAASLGGALAPLMADRPHLNNAQITVPIAAIGVALAAQRQRRAAGRPPPPRRPPRRPFSLIPYLAVAATDALLIATRDDPDVSLPIAVAAVGLTAIVVVRQIVAFYDNARLLRRVDASLLEVQEAQRQLAHQASHDSLTGLANRDVFEQRIREATAAGRLVSVALVDLDDFKAVNDRLGHVVGDRLLVAVADRLRRTVRPEDLVARLGGDEFALLLGEVPAADAPAVLARLGAVLEQPVRVEPHDLLIRSSAGLADGWPGADPTELLRRADVAMYAAKERGKGGGARYEPDLDRRAENDAQLGAELRRALDLGEFHLLYQPIVRLPEGSLVGVEALVRWRRSDGRIVPPAEFIVAAERTGLIVPLGRWILHEACRQNAEWTRDHHRERQWSVGVNISARQLREPGFAAEVATVLRETGLAAERLLIEVTETAVFDNEPAVAALVAISAFGVRIGLDDFGTGHSSLGLLRTCPVDVLKVDKSFIDGITGTRAESVIATALIQITEGLNLAAVAEGVETAAQAERLYELGYRLAQGYHFARPLPPDEVGRLLAGSPVVGASH